MSALAATAAAACRRGAAAAGGRRRALSSTRAFVPGNIELPAHVHADTPPPTNTRLAVHDAAAVAKLRRAGALARRMCDAACAMAAPGVTGNAIDAAIHAEIIAAGAYPAPLGYKGFPKSITVSPNEVVCHGIPSDRPIADGDIVSFDVSVFLDGVFGDTCATVCVGDVAADARALVDISKEAMDAGIAECRPGACLSSIGAAIHSVCDSHNVSTVRAFCGHGIGELLHMAPLVQHYRNNERLQLREGLVFTIEPMISAGTDSITVGNDGWTVSTADGKLASQWEHTLVVTKDGCELLSVE